MSAVRIISGCKVAAAAAALMLPATAACVATLTRRALPRIKGELMLPGLEGEVRVDYDRWGVPHIQSRSLEDAIFAQGFVTAQDRMIQLELFRRIGAGTLAEVMGRKALSIDTFMRDMGMRRTASRIAEYLPSDTRRYLERYAAGINAYLQSRRSALPIELILLAAGRPRPWTVVDSLNSLLFFNWTMDATWTADLMRGRLIRSLGRKEAEMLLPASGPTSRPAVAYGEGEPPASVDPSPDCELDFLPFKEDDPPWMVKKVFVHAQGSNNWTLRGARTSTGKPYLCNDPHVQHTIPTLFYLSHIRSQQPHCDVIGATFPGIPGVFIGRNEHIAWGATSLSPDVVDLYIETFEDETSLRYRAGGGWEEAESTEEVIKVFPGRKVRHQVISTRRGPLIARKGNKGLALKWVGHDPENDSAGCFVRLGLAKDWEEFNRGLEGYSGPAVNLVYADTEDNIAYVAAGRIPLRQGHDGSVPLPGDDAAYEWRGYIPAQEMPRTLNPEQGWIATANNQVVDAGYPYHLTSMWEPSCRQARIAELLEAREKHDLEHMRDIQGDIFTYHGSVLRREMMRACEEWKNASPHARKALDILSRWDCRAAEDSAGQALYYVTWKVLTERLLRHRLGHRMYFEYTTSFFNVNHAVERILTARCEAWLPPSASTFEELLLQCLEEAVVRLQVRFGTPAMEEWDWGRLHSLEIPHFMAALKPLDRLLNLGPVPFEGDGETVNCAFPAGDPTIQVLARSSMGGGSELPFLPGFHSDRVYAGPVFRMIVDLSPHGRSVWSLDVGQCAHPMSRFYRDFFPVWKKVGHVPMAFRDEEVREATYSTLLLKPLA